MNLPSVALCLPAGDEAVVALHGAQVLSWRTADGAERLYLSPRAVLDGQAAIRGGVPVCFPQFNERGPLPKHGFARNLAWAVVPGSQSASATEARVRLRLAADERTRALWPAAFAATLAVVLTPGGLRVAMDVENTGAEAWGFALALHTYLQVPDIAAVRLQGLGGAAYWDAVAQAPRTQAEPVLAFAGEVDRVYSRVAGAPEAPLRVAGLEIRQSASFGQTVVWNPGAARCAQIADMPPEGYTRMLCVEAAQVDEPVPLAPGQHWHGWQSLAVAA